MRHGVRINWAFEEMGCLCGAAGLDDAGALTSHLIAAANTEEPCAEVECP